MESSSSSLESMQKAAGLRTGAYENPDLIGGFLIGSSLLGLLVIIGAFWYNRRNLSLFKRSCSMSIAWQENRLMSVQAVYSCLSTLLLIDVLNLIVTLIYGAAEISSSCNVIDCFLTEYMWLLSRWFGVIIHLVNALLFIYNLRQPLSVARVHIAFLLVSAVIIIIVPLYMYFYKAAIFTLAAFMFLFALSVIVAFRAPTSSPSTATLKKWIIAVAMCNFLVVYFPTFIVQCLAYTNVYVDYSIAYTNVLVFTNLHIIFDGLQCALFLKFPSGEEQHQQEQQLQEWKPQQQQQQQQQQQWQPQQQQQQWQPQQQQKLGFQNAGFTGSTNVYQ